MNITDVNSTDWQISLLAPGLIAQGANDINQSLNIIFTTQQGSDPVRFDFGIDLLAEIDKPVNVMAPNLVQKIIVQVATYETRIDLNTVNYSILDSGGVLFTTTWAYKPGTVLDGNRSISDISEDHTTYFLLADQNGFILMTDYDVSLIVN